MRASSEKSFTAPSSAYQMTDSTSNRLDIVATVVAAGAGDNKPFISDTMNVAEETPLLETSKVPEPTLILQNPNFALSSPQSTPKSGVTHFSEPWLTKTFTEPTNLSELLKNVSSNFHKRFFPLQQQRISPSDSLISVDAKQLRNIDEKQRKLTSLDKQEENFSSDFNVTDKLLPLKSQLVQGSSSFHLRQPDAFSSRSSNVCDQCPRCRNKQSFFNKLLPSAVANFDNCDCRICRILNPATSPSLVKDASTTLPYDTRELGALCQICGQNGPSKTENGRRCSRFNETTAFENPIDISPSAIVPSASMSGVPLNCREQGVQVSKWSLSSVSSCSGPLCRICHSPGDKVESLMSPCRCSGSLKFVHMSCLLRWLEISRRKLHRAPHCELCGYKYQRHKIMRFRRFQCPPCSRRDKILHVTFVLSILIMIVCASTTIICFKSDRPKAPSDRIELTGQEVVTLVCGVMFFCAFFLAMYVQVKSQVTIYKLVLRFWIMNQEWQIEEYRRERDIEFRGRITDTREISSV